MSDTFEEGKELEVINEFMEQQQTKINQLQQQILLLTTKNTMLEKELNKLKSINSEYKEQLDKLTRVDRKSLSNYLDDVTSERNEAVLKEKIKRQQKRKSSDGSMFKNRGVGNGINN
jgi:predicted RNase H-like nuclease (RuvC/YqgF family)